MAEVEFRYTVEVDEGDVEWDDEAFRFRLTDEGLARAYESAVDGFTDDENGWHPRYVVLCLTSFMAGQVCGLELNHEGGCR